MATSDPRGGNALARAFTVQGGQVSVFCGRGDVRVTAVTPARGFAESESRDSPDSLRITFTGNRHISRVSVTWRNGCYGEVSESV